MGPRFLGRYRHLIRFREIVNVLGKHGLGFLLGYLDLKFHKSAQKSKEVNHLSVAQRIRMALEELGPTFVKLGQLLSIRPDLLPREYLEQLEFLQDQVQPLSYDDIKKVVEQELEAPLENIFNSFEEIPLASASIGQVHKGVLASGEMVVIKVQRPGVEKQVDVDLAILFDLARLGEKRTKWGAHYKLMDVAEELARTIIEELDYTIEGRNADRLAENFIGDSSVKFPKIYWQYTTKKVLLMEYVESVKISNFSTLKDRGYNVENVATNLATAILKQIYLHGFFHADPHPGNLGVLENETIVFMDFGMVGRLEQNLRERFVSMILAIIAKDIDGIVSILMEIGVAARKVDKKALKRDISRLMDKYYYLPLSELQIGDILREMFTLAYVYKVKIPAEVTLVAKTLVTGEGLIQQLDPKVSVIQIAESFGKILLKEKYSPKRLKRDLVQHLLEVIRITKALPKRFDNLIGLIEDGELKIKLEHKNFQNLAFRLNVISNRLAFSIITGSIIIGSSLIVGNTNKSLLLRFPIAEIGFVVAVVMGLWLLISILRSGRI